ncbi:DHA2 family efflux MFS transporter permease subunit [Nocardia wallacei]|uniref:MFS transporter n=1 Tax=Nocardia wallacei TaxID=480035 RepID=A0A7G1KN37_9NOCA|nr:DHA2 family efflux MFS transporter permease subunit [Nocardia wallacei]BCK55309.1 MFS transporter [Nocardia wallacei]
MSPQRNPWPALIAMVIGFFLTTADMMVVMVINPVILRAMDASVPQVIWVTSAYLLAFAVPLLICGRLGDRFGPKYIYLAGLAVFTLASLWCGLAQSIGMLIAARVVQGLGASLMTPQTMAVITRTFPAAKRSAAMSLWGATAGFALLVGPILGGTLSDTLGWRWIFFINIPVGVVGLALGLWLVPTLRPNPHRFDILGVVLSAVGMFLLVYGLQEGDIRNWDALIRSMIAGGVVVLAVFVFTQARGGGEPLLPLRLFRDRNFALGNIAIVSTGATATAAMVPLYFFLEVVRGMSPTRSALVFAPMAAMMLVFAPVVGKIGERAHPRLFPLLGFTLYAVTIIAMSALMSADAPTVWFVLVGAVTGFANACTWAPLAATATRNLPEQQAGAGSGVYNALRQVGSVIGSAAIAAAMTARMSAHGLAEGKIAASGTAALPEAAKEPLGSALSQTMYLPVGFLAAGIVAALLFESTTRGADDGVTPTDPSRPAESATV